MLVVRNRDVVIALVRLAAAAAAVLVVTAVVVARSMAAFPETAPTVVVPDGDGPVAVGAPDGDRVPRGPYGSQGSR